MEKVDSHTWIVLATSTTEHSLEQRIKNPEKVLTEKEFSDLIVYACSLREFDEMKKELGELYLSTETSTYSKNVPPTT